MYMTESDILHVFILITLKHILIRYIGLVSQVFFKTNHDYNFYLNKKFFPPTLQNNYSTQNDVKTYLQHHFSHDKSVIGHRAPHESKNCPQYFLYQISTLIFLLIEYPDFM